MLRCWDEQEGVPFPGIVADSKAKANAIARSMAERNGLLGWGKGRVWLKAEEED